MSEEELIKFKSGVIDVTLPKTDENLDIILRIVEGIKVGTSQSPSKVPDEVPNSQEKLEREVKKQSLACKSPHNTALFDNWLQSNHIREFEINDFINQHSNIGKETVIKIIAYKIAHKKLQQLSNTRFKVLRI
jgi:hypothetical protein